jgi:hypothetical protein
MRGKIIVRIVLALVVLNILANIRSYRVWRARRERLSQPEVLHV